jgi:DNA-binding IclR family transcriptional regulator
VLERFTETTLTSPAELEQQLGEVRLRGFATCRGEYEASAWGVSAPVIDTAGRLVAVLSIWGPGTRVTDTRLEVLGPLVQTTAATLLDR